MFTGLIGSVGQIGTVTRGDLDICITVIMSPDFAQGIALGDSIAVNGVCLTVAQIDDNVFTFYVSRESLLCTTFTDLLAGDKVNLEKCLTLSSPIGGHMITGHVHGAAEIRSIEAEGESWVFEIEVPRDLMKYMVAKGAIALDGVSLTINSVSKRCIFVNCIPHTMAHTNLSAKQVGDGLNLEIDLILIYIDRLLTGENFGDVRLVSPDLISRALGVKITEH